MSMSVHAALSVSYFQIQATTNSLSQHLPKHFEGPLIFEDGSS